MIETSHNEASMMHSTCVSKLNESFHGKSISFGELKQFLNSLLNEETEIEHKLKLHVNEVSSSRGVLLDQCKDVENEILHLNNDAGTLAYNIENHISNVSEVMKKVSPLCDSETVLEKCEALLCAQLKIEEFSADIQSSLIIGCLDKAVLRYLDLIVYYNLISKTHCINLLNFINAVKSFWYGVIRDFLCKDFEKHLDSCHWPDMIDSASVELKKELSNSLYLLLQLESTTNAFGKDIAPIQIMLKPIKKRFYYHFCGNKKTNNLQKPEWYLTQCLVWLKNALPFLKEDVLPVFIKANLKDISPMLVYAQELFNVIKEKVNLDMKELMLDDELFSHYVDELLLFDRELLQCFNTSTIDFGCLAILLEESCFVKWLEVEQNFALERMDNMLTSTHAWNYYPGQPDDIKVPECGENFAMMLQAITERYKNLPSFEHRRRFFQLQLELLDNFRIRLVQLIQNRGRCTLNLQMTAMLNVVSYLSNQLRDWSQLPFFAQFEITVCENFKINHNGTFCDVIDLLDQMLDKTMKDIVDHVVQEVISVGHEYVNNKWENIMVSVSADSHLSVSACGWMSVVRNALYEAHNLLCVHLFNHFWKLLAAKLNDYIYNQVIMNNKFSEGGAIQLAFDMNKNLFAIFSEYTSRPESYMRDVKDACTLLSLSSGALFLLKDVLFQALHADVTLTSNVDPISALHDIGVSKLELEEVELLLTRRIISVH